MTTRSPSPALEPFTSSHLPVLSGWLRRPHVARWYPVPEDNETWAENPPPGGSQCFISFGSRPVGYIRWQVVDRETLDSVGLDDIPAHAVDVDLLIGEPQYLGQGLGPAVLELLIERLRTDERLPLVGLTSSVQNTRAHRAFEKAGFRIARQYTPAGFGPCHLFVRSLHTGVRGTRHEDAIGPGCSPPGGPGRVRS